MTGGAKKSKSKKASKKASKKSSKKASKKGSKKMTGGGKKSKKSSKKASKKASKKRSKKMSGGANAGFEAFLELKKKIASDLGVPNGPAAGKVAAVVQKEIKEQNMGSDGKPSIPAVEVSKKAYDLFKTNVEKYKKALN